MTDFSYQLYSSRNFPPLADTLSMLAGLGYKQVEGYGALFNDLQSAQDIRAQLDAAGLAMPTAHLGLELVESDPDLAKSIAETLGLTTVLIPYLMPDDRPTDDAGWSAFGDRVAAAGKPLQSAGLGYGWHNHDFELIPTSSGAMPLDLIMRADLDLKLELDLAWVKRADQDPVTWTEKYSDRLCSVHVKDVAAAGENADEDGWADVGDGVMDWADISEAVKKSSAKYLIMEHDNPSDHQRFAARSIETARKFWS